MLLDLALDLMVPPLSYLALAVALGLLASLVGLVLGLQTVVGAGLWSLAALALVMYVARGVCASGLGMRAVGDLLLAPAFVLWKLGLWFHSDPHWRGEWVRTTRAKRIK